MPPYPGKIYVRVSHPQLPDAVHSALRVKSTPEETVKYLNKLSQQRKVGATYQLATEEEYWEYRNGR